MDNRQLVNEISSLGEKIDALLLEIEYLRNDLEKTRELNEGLKFRISELESALHRNNK